MDVNFVIIFYKQETRGDAQLSIHFIYSVSVDIKQQRHNLKVYHTKYKRREFPHVWICHASSNSMALLQEYLTFSHNRGEHFHSCLS